MWKIITDTGYVVRVHERLALYQIQSVLRDWKVYIERIDEDKKIMFVRHYI